MGKRKSRSKRSLGSLPKGLPVRSNSSGKKSDINPFEITQKIKRPKFDVHNRGLPSANSTKHRTSALALALQKRKTLLKESLQQSKKDNVFADKRIGEYNSQMTMEEQQLARLVRERASRSKKISKYSLDDDNDNDGGGGGGMILTHRGKNIDTISPADHELVSDDDDDEKGNLDAADTAFHFGGGTFDKEKQKLRNSKNQSPYGPASTTTTDANDDNNLLGQYSDPNRKMELEDLILRRKLMKAEKLKSREEQVTTFEKLDEDFSELANMLTFRDKSKDYIKSKPTPATATTSGTPIEEDDYDEWDKEMKQYLYNTTITKVKAADRTKTPEEIAKEEYDRLHKLETRRLARMNGDFTNDNLDDIDSSSSDDDDDDDSDDDDTENGRSKKKSKYVKKSSKNKLSSNNQAHPEDLDDDSDNDDDEDDDKLDTKFTADGLVYVDKLGTVVGKVGEVDIDNYKAKNKDSKKNSQYDYRNDIAVLKVGMRVSACYHAKEQFIDEDNKDALESAAWYNGVIAGVNPEDNTYNIDYDDGDYEDNVERQHIRVLEKTDTELEKELTQQNKEVVLRKKRQIAQEKARSDIPYVFEVPTTLDALHDIIGQYATTGADVALIIQRIHKANSVTLDKRNMEKMQNFYDLLLRRFIAVGDAIHNSGDGGNELCRYKQIDALTVTLYEMAQESPDCAASVWSRRLGILHKAHAKRLRDAGFVREDEGDANTDDTYTIWPSTGVILLLRVIGHIFPVTDKKHPIVTPLILFLGQILTTTPLLSKYDLVAGLMCCGILLEYTKEAKRVVPEAHAFLAGIIRLFANHKDEQSDTCNFSLPTISVASNDDAFQTLRKEVSSVSTKKIPNLSLEKKHIQKGADSAASILVSALYFVETCVNNINGALSGSEREAFADITESILNLDPKNKSLPLPKEVQLKVAAVAASLEKVCKFNKPRVPLQRRAGESSRGVAIKSLAPRIENPDKYSMSKDKGKSANQSAADRTRREYKREHKAVARELRLDGTFIENERRIEETKKSDAARAKRHKAFAWLEGEQAAMNQQVRLGGGLLQGGGTGAAKMKARSGKLGIKKGGKF